MNVQELKRNKVLTEFATRDLNKDPRLPYEDDSFDVVTNAGERWRPPGCVGGPCVGGWRPESSTEIHEGLVLWLPSL